MGRPARSPCRAACAIPILLLLTIAAAGDAAAQEAAQAPRDGVPLLEAELDAAVPEAYRLCPDAFLPCTCGGHQGHGAHRGYKGQAPYTSAELTFTRRGGKRFCCCPGGSAPPPDPCGAGTTEILTAVLGFDDLLVYAGDPVGVPPSYGGFAWSSASALVLKGTASQCGFLNGVVSPDNVLFNSGYAVMYMSAPQGVLFTVTSLKATAGLQNNATAIIRGFDGNGNQVGQVTATVNNTAPVTMDLTRLGCISTLTMEAACGVDEAGGVCDTGYVNCNNDRTFLVVDDIVVTRYNATSARNTWRPAALPTDNAHGGDVAGSGVLPRNPRKGQA